jgi:hypothetical protein
MDNMDLMWLAGVIMETVLIHGHNHEFRPKW